MQNDFHPVLPIDFSMKIDPQKGRQDFLTFAARNMFPIHLLDIQLILENNSMQPHKIVELQMIKSLLGCKKYEFKILQKLCKEKYQPFLSLWGFACGELYKKLFDQL